MRPSADDDEISPSFMQLLRRRRRRRRRPEATREARGASFAAAAIGEDQER